MENRLLSSGNRRPISGIFSCQCRRKPQETSNSEHVVAVAPWPPWPLGARLKGRIWKCGRKGTRVIARNRSLSFSRHCGSWLVVALRPLAPGLADCFVTEGIHSASSDFEAPRLKPDPSVYIKAGEWTEVPMSQAIAVDSSPEGIMAASRAGVSLIIGYIGTKFDSQNELYEFANQLLRPGGSDRGAALVIDDLRDISPIVAEFANSCTSEHWQGDPAQLAAVCEGNAFLKFYTPIVEETAAP